MSITLPSDFQFSQSALQDYTDCHRRFYLRYVKQQRYPAPESEPLRDFEERMEQGDRFHHMIHQHQIGISADVLRSTTDDDDLILWFDRYLTTALTNLPPNRYAELSLTIPTADRRLIAKYDLLAIQPGERAVIMDWKTAPRRPTRDELASRWQTILYPYVLAKAGAHLYGGSPVPPEHITMIYWFAEAPDQPEVFRYDAAAHARAESRLNDVVAELLARPDDESAFPLTPDEHRCRFCVYRTYCQRGTQAGDALALLDAEDATDARPLDLDLDQVAEIAF